MNNFHKKSDITKPIPALDFSDVSLTFNGPRGPINILRNVNLQVSGGETIGIVGPSGSGKTTMLMVAAGLEKTSAGNITVSGQNYKYLGEDGLAQFRRDNIGIVFQSFYLIPTMTALENVALPLELAQKPNAFKIAEHQLSTVGLEDRAYHYPKQLSGGEQQRVALARAFGPNPNILLADEPTGNLDRKTGSKIVELLFEMHSQHKTTLLLITHDIKLAERCNRVIYISDGYVSEH
ncbi:MAG: ABC transporter [Rhodospirillaceae bacterium]|nr:ABC transporter [Rhodospirillaceae bacterium]